MDKQIAKNKRKVRRQAKVRSQISGTKARPRLNVYRSNEHIYAQLIDDTSGKTLVSAHTKEVKDLKVEDGEARKVKQSFELGKILAEKATKEKITTVIFDRGARLYHGRVKAVADGAREGGLIF